MANALSSNDTIESIVTEVKKFNSTEQKIILAYIKAKRYKAQRREPVAKYQKKIKALSMTEIDRIKHQSRKSNENK